MDILNYLQPENQFAAALIYVLLGLFFIWAAYLTYMWISIYKHGKAIQRTENIDKLADGLVEYLNKKEDEGRAKLKGVFLRFCSDQRIPEDGIVGRHIRAIYNAGINDSRLNAGELIKHTARVMFRGNNLLKTLLGIFIVIGLLGTLLGLTDSLAALSPSLTKGDGGTSSQELSRALSNLFVSLKTAFAPSIWGVFLTVISIVVYGVYLRFACYNAKNALERATLTVWVPRLFLTTSQRLVDTLQVSEHQIQKNLEAIQGVVDMQELVQTDVDELSKKLKSTNKALASMEGSASGLKAFTDSFTTAVTKLTSYQEEIHGLYDNIVQSSKLFQDNVRESAGLHQTSLETFRRQNETMQNMFTSLKSYENAYVNQRKTIDSKMQNMAESAQQAYKALAERNKDVIAELGKPIADQLNRIDESMRTGFDNIEQRFGKFDSPISKAAEQIEGSLETVVKRSESMTEKLEREFYKLNETIKENLNGLVSGIETQSKRLADGTDAQNETSGVMNEKVTLLAVNIETLNKSVQGLNESSKASESVLAQMGSLGDFGQKIGSLIDTIAQGNKTQETQFRGLLKQLEDSSNAQEQHTKSLTKEIGTLNKAVDKLAKKTAKGQKERASTGGGKGATPNPGPNTEPEPSPRGFFKRWFRP